MITMLYYMGKEAGGGAIHSWKNTRTAQSRLCYFFKLAVLFFCGHASTVLFAFCCEN